MTNEQAAMILDPETTRDALTPYAYDPEQRLRVVEEACRVAVHALRPGSRQNELIHRADAIRESLDLYHSLTARRDACQASADVGGVMVWTAAAEIAQAMVRRLMELPGVEAEPVRHSRWEFIRRFGSTRPYHCSCGYASPGRFPYCPCCGAWMDGGDGPAAE